MRVAILSDIHGNLIGLDAVLEDIEAQGGVDSYWFLGDYCFGGANPVGVLERITKLPNASFIYGNADRYLFQPDNPASRVQAVSDHLENLQRVLDSLQDQYWTLGAICQANWLNWLQALPLELHFTLPDGTKVLLVHSSPKCDENPGLYPNQSDDEVRSLFSQAEEQLIFVGHTHVQQERYLDSKHIINPGCIGKPVGQDTRAAYALLEVDTTGYEISLRRVDYDVESVLQDMRQRNFSGADFLTPFYRGEFIPAWDR